MTAFHCVQNGIKYLDVYFNVSTLAPVFEDGHKVIRLKADKKFQEFSHISGANISHADSTLDFAIIDLPTNPKLSALVTNEMTAEVGILPSGNLVSGKDLSLVAISTERESPVHGNCKLVGITKTIFAKNTITYPLMNCDNSFMGSESFSGAPLFLENKIIGILKAGGDENNTPIVVSTADMGESFTSQRYRLLGSFLSLPKWEPEATYESKFFQK